MGALRKSIAIDRCDTTPAPACASEHPAYPGADLTTPQLALIAERAVGPAFAVDELYLRGRRRGARRLAHARGHAMALVHLVCGRSQEDVARAFKRNRTTIANHMEMVELLNDVREHEAYWDRLVSRFLLLVELSSQPSLRLAWFGALKGIDRSLDDGDLEGEAVSQALHVRSVFWEERMPGGSDE